MKKYIIGSIFLVSCILLVILYLKSSKELLRIEYDDKIDFPIYKQGHGCRPFSEIDLKNAKLFGDTLGDYPDTICPDLKSGLNKISFSNFPYYDLDDTLYLPIFSYKTNDTLFIMNLLPTGIIETVIVNDKFYANCIYHTDIAGRYTSGNSRGTYLELPIKYGRLIFKKEVSNIGDTIRGFMYYETAEYESYDKLNIDYYKGPFVTVIVPEDTFKNYMYQFR